MGPHAELGVHAAALRPVVRRSGEQLDGEHTVGDHPLLVVDVVDEQVEREQALDETALDDGPLVAGDHAGDEVERPGTVDVGAVGVHGERDAHRQDLDLGDPLPLGQLLRAESVEHRHQRGGDGTRLAVPVDQLIHPPRT